MIQKQHIERSREIESMKSKYQTAAESAEETGDRFVMSWENSTARIQQVEQLFSQALLDKKTDWENDIKIKFECLVFEGEDKRWGKLGINYYTDMANMRQRYADFQFNTYIENLFKSKWFMNLVIKLREKLETLFQPPPISCFKFLLAIKQVLGLGHSLTAAIFYELLESLVLKEDHKDVIVHRILKSIRDVLSIRDDDFLTYLEKNEIQPCPELLSQVRSLKKQMMAKKLAGINKTGFLNALINPKKDNLVAARQTFKVGKQVIITPVPLEIVEDANNTLTSSTAPSVSEEGQKRRLSLQLKRVQEDKNDANDKIFETFSSSFNMFGDTSTFGSSADLGTQSFESEDGNLEIKGRMVGTVLSILHEDDGFDN